MTRALHLAAACVATTLIACGGSQPALRSHLEEAVATPRATSVSTPVPLPTPVPGPVAFEVCFDNDSWVRPSHDEQAHYMASDYRLARYGGLGAKEREAFDSHFWRDVFSASWLFGMLDLSGLWSSRNAEIGLNEALGGPCRARVIAGPEAFDLMNLWLLGYEATGAEMDTAGRVIIRVTSKPAGLQIIQLRIAGGSRCCPGLAVDFVDESGILIESMDSVSGWSRTP